MTFRTAYVITATDSMAENDSAGWFSTTHWSVVLAARDDNSPEAGAALEQLCRPYWRPLYSFLRRSGHSPEDAMDLTQGFFERLLEKRALAAADPERGRFRSFLLASLKNFVADFHDKANAQKRGGGASFISLNERDAEDSYAKEPSHTQTPDKIFDRRWALTVLKETLARLRTAYVQREGQLSFAQVKEFLFRTEQTVQFAEAAESLGVNPNTLRSTVSRLRERYREELRRVVADTVLSPGEIEDEIRYLMTLFSD
jgi:RNA polymerase sigma-70 factor (ECF subfamily)